MKIENELILSKLIMLYGEDSGKTTLARLETILEDFLDLSRQENFSKSELFSQQDVMLITYADLLKAEKKPPLEVLHQFYLQELKEVINIIHILPFFPFTSDDGFSVIDYLSVDPALGDWQDIERFQKDQIRLMFDAVINHCSTQSVWFQKFLKGNAPFDNYFIETDPNEDFSLVTRPRTTPLITRFESSAGYKWVWTTFSADQVDLNYKSPDVFLEIVRILLKYVRAGASLIRLDAIAYLWKELGTNCIHLPQTHLIIQIIRSILDELKRNVLIVTETNVPHPENISYFGNGENEAHIVYQFPLPPLVAHAILSGDSSYLSKWAETLVPPSPKTTFLNFTASHDGVGVMPLIGILPENERQFLFDKAVQHGGRISSKTDSNGKDIPYELNINYFDLLNNNGSGETMEIQVKRFLVSQAIPLVLAGIPAVYLHSLLGSRNDCLGVQKTGRPRSINRQKLNLETIEKELTDPQNLRHVVFNRYRELVARRINEPAFHPNAKQSVINLGSSLFVLVRTPENEDQKILLIINLTNHNQVIKLPQGLVDQMTSEKLTDLLTGKEITRLEQINLGAYEMLWLKNTYSLFGDQPY